MSRSIYNLEAEYLELAEAIIENNGEVTEEQSQALAINKESLEVKAVKYGYVTKQIKDDIANIDAEIKRLEALKAPMEKSIARIEEAVSTAMKLYGIEEIKMQNLKVYFHPSTSTEIIDEKLIPRKYKTKEVVTTIKIDKKKILADLRNDIPVKGAVLKKNSTIKFK